VEDSGVALASAESSPSIACIKEDYNETLVVACLFKFEGSFYQKITNPECLALR
jgi:hypothetical protein